MASDYLKEKKLEEKRLKAETKALLKLAKEERIEKETSRARTKARVGSFIQGRKAKFRSGARSRTKPAVLIYMIAGLIILYILITRANRLPKRITQATDGLSAVWGPLTGAVK